MKLLQFQAVGGGEAPTPRKFWKLVFSSSFVLIFAFQFPICSYLSYTFIILSAHRWGEEADFLGGYGG